MAEDPYADETPQERLGFENARQATILGSEGVAQSAVTRPQHASEAEKNLVRQLFGRV
eukprot:CAMPEP_0117531416 /NCGR_PEP_ID=MMETSP0784-20121206/38847_1 /TAXON_ID=39447 /ORGANISM="" /LENGTH=57 /DNA_ID=CAMNT_0005327789 /DNA_START=324 /DNA_END=497 /DNA_ORIENTATION=-